MHNINSVYDGKLESADPSNGRISQAAKGVQKTFQA